MKLNQVIAILNGVKAQSKAKTTHFYQLAQKTALFQGINRTYSPREEDGYVYPSENQSVQMSAADVIDGFQSALAELLDVALTQDFANTTAFASIKIGDTTIAENVPVTYLLFLEKQLIDIRTFATALPVLPIDKNWAYDSNKGVWASAVKETAKTKKITDFVVAYEATKEHPAQIKEVSKDIVEGTWAAIDLSGALPQDTKTAILKRIDLLHQAVVKAREEANSKEITEKKISDALFSYVFDTMSSSTN